MFKGIWRKIFGKKWRRNPEVELKHDVPIENGGLLVPAEMREGFLDRIIPVVDEKLGIPVLATVTGPEGEWKGPAFLKGMESWSASHAWPYVDRPSWAIDAGRD